MGHYGLVHENELKNDEFSHVSLVAGFETEGLCPVVWPGGETEALTRIEKQFGKDSASVNICHY